MLYKINELVKKTGLTKETIRYYEDMDLIRPVKRDKNNYRLYSDEVVEQLSYIAVGKKLGFTLNEIKMILEEDLYRNSIKDVETLVIKKADEIERKLASLETQLKTLNEIKDKLKSMDSDSCISLMD